MSDVSIRLSSGRQEKGQCPGGAKVKCRNDPSRVQRRQLYIDPAQRAWLEEQTLQAFPYESELQDEAIKDMHA